jgi:hypothetical protein
MILNLKHPQNSSDSHKAGSVIITPPYPQKLALKIRQPVAVARSEYFACGLKTKEMFFIFPRVIFLNMKFPRNFMHSQMSLQHPSM